MVQFTGLCGRNKIIITIIPIIIIQQMPMYNQVWIFLLLTTMLCPFCSCNSTKKTKVPLTTNISYKDSLFIDFDFDKVAKYYSDKIANGDSISIKKEEGYRALATATDRFWKTVVYVDGKLSSSLKNAAEINVSERVFNGFMKQLTDGNEFIQESIKKGKTPSVSIYKQSATKTK